MAFPRVEIELVGNLGKPPEARYTPDGNPVTKFSLGVTRKWKGGTGEKCEETSWWTVTTWGHLAEAVQHLTTGQQVLVKGYIKPDPATGCPRIWKHSDGSPGASYEITATEVWASLFGKSASGQQAGVGADAEDPQQEIPY